MEHMALYRKYRTKTFDEIVGQTHIVRSLKNQIKSDAISHAYLFCGTRGTGKTSIARIFARAINCEHPVDGSPCGKCHTCQVLSSPNSMDIIEIDAASNNRVDEIRDINDKVKYPPVDGKYKVYIIDEVHMLTDSAFNALLKTLEEPPKHVVFILATTDVQKLPATILSRLMRFDFKLISKDDLVKHLEHVFTDSGVKYEKEALDMIATLGEGSVRDTLSIADMCIAYTDGNVTYSSVVEALGTIDKSSLYDISANILNHDGAELLGKIDSLCAKGKSIIQITKDLVTYFRDLAVVKTCKDYDKILKYPSDVLEQMQSAVKNIDVHDIINILVKLSSLEGEYRATTSPRAIFEITLMDIVYGTSSDVNNRLDNIEKQLKNMVSP